jgi:hypothetical protein
MTEFLGDETRLMQLADGGDADAVRSGLRNAKALAGRLNLGSASDWIEVLKQLITRITLAATSIEIAVRMPSIWPVGESSTGSATISVPMLLKRCGPAVRLIVRASYPGKARAPDPRLVALLAKAQRWFKSLSLGTGIGQFGGHPGDLPGLPGAGHRGAGRARGASDRIEHQAAFGRGAAADAVE